jgi:DNA-binding Lrp family transcriptional regulator
VVEGARLESVYTETYRGFESLLLRQKLKEGPVGPFFYFEGVGGVDYLLRAVVSDIDGYDRLYKELIRADLFDVSSSFVMETLKCTTALPL